MRETQSSSWQCNTDGLFFITDIKMSNALPRGPPRIVSLAQTTRGASQQSTFQTRGSQTITLPAAPSTNDSEFLRSQIAQQQAQIEALNSRVDVLTRSLEQLVAVYRELKCETDSVKKQDNRTQARLTTVESDQTKIRQQLNTVEYHATIGYQNATADDQARQYMYDVRHMDDNDTLLTDGEIQREVTRINDNRRNRRY